MTSLKMTEKATDADIKNIAENEKSSFSIPLSEKELYEMLKNTLYRISGSRFPPRFREEIFLRKASHARVTHNNTLSNYSRVLKISQAFLPPLFRFSSIFLDLPSILLCFMPFFGDTRYIFYENR